MESAWRGDVVSWIDRINELMTTEDAGLRFVVNGFQSWDERSSGGGIEDLVASLRLAASTASGDIVLGLAERRRVSGAETADEFAGACVPFCRYVVVRVPRSGDPDWPYVAEVIAHEMFHVFGAFHCDDEPTVMRPQSEWMPMLDLDGGTVRILRTYGSPHVPIGQGIESVLPSQIDEITAAYVAGHSVGESNPVVTRLVERARELFESGADIRARELLEAAVDVSSRSGPDHARVSDSLRALLRAAGGGRERHGGTRAGPVE